MNVPIVIMHLQTITGWSQAKLAAHLGVSQPDISRWKKGSEPKGHNMEALRQLAVEYGVLDASMTRQAIPIIGYIGAGGEVDGWLDQTPDDGMDRIDLPDTAAIASSMVTDPVGFRVRGDSMYPRFRDGEVLIVERSPAFGVESAIYHEAAVITADGLRYIKRLMPGRRHGVYTLESVNPSFPPIFDIAIRWASPVRFIIPDIGLRVR